MRTAHDLRVITCNLRTGTSYAAAGAKAYLLQISGGSGRQVLVRSRSGRWVQVWRSAKELVDFRVTTVVATSSLHPRLAEFGQMDDDLMAQICENSSEVQV